MKKLDKMDQTSNEQVYEAQSMKGMLQKNCLEKVVYERKQKNLENERKCLLRQHSRDETEMKHILQRLQHEQHLLVDDDDIEETEKDDIDNSDDESQNDSHDDEGVINPYPVTIVPKFGPNSPRQNFHFKFQKGSQDTGSRMGRRKSLEYEDIDNSALHRKSKQQLKNPVLSSSSTNRLQTQNPSRKIPPSTDQIEVPDTWAGDPEFISSVRRPRKPASEFGQKRFLKRALSEIWSRPSSALTASASSVSNVRRAGSLKSNKNKHGTESKSNFEGQDIQQNFQIPSVSKGKKDQYKIRAESPSINADEKYQPDVENIDKTLPSPKRKSSTEMRKISSGENKTQGLNKSFSPKHERKGSFKDRKSNVPEKADIKPTEKEIENMSSGYRKDSLKARTKAPFDENKDDDDLPNTCKCILPSKDNVIHDSFTEQRKESVVRLTGKTRHGSLKKIKGKVSDCKEFSMKQTMRHGLLSPIAIGTDKPEPETNTNQQGRNAHDSNKKLRSKSTGTSPASSPVTSPFVKDGKFYY